MDPACTPILIRAFLFTPIFTDESEISSLWCWSCMSVRVSVCGLFPPVGHLVNADFSLHRLLTSF